MQIVSKAQSVIIVHYQHKASLYVALPRAICWLARLWSMNMNSDRGRALSLCGAPSPSNLATSLCSLFVQCDRYFYAFIFAPLSAVSLRKIPLSKLNRRPRVLEAVPNSWCFAPVFFVPLVECFVQNWCFICSVRWGTDVTTS